MTERHLVDVGGVVDRRCRRPGRHRGLTMEQEDLRI